MYQKHEMGLVEFDETDVFTLVLNGSEDGGEGGSGTSSYGGDSPSDM